MLPLTFDRLGTVTHCSYTGRQNSLLFVYACAILYKSFLHTFKFSAKLIKSSDHLLITSRKVSDVIILVPQLNTVAVATALPFIPTGNISVNMSQETKTV